MKLLLLLLSIIASVFSVLANAIKINEWWQKMALTAKPMNWANIGRQVDKVMRFLAYAQAGLMLLTLSFAVVDYWQRLYNPHMKLSFSYKVFAFHLSQSSPG